nr:unnamed protein product [Callosobruchus analis]
MWPQSGGNLSIYHPRIEAHTDRTGNQHTRGTWFRSARTTFGISVPHSLKYFCNM